MRRVLLGAEAGSLLAFPGRGYCCPYCYLPSLLFSITVQWGWVRGGRQTTCPSVSRNQPHSDLEGNLEEPFTVLDFEPQLQGRDESLWLSPWKKACMDCTDAMWLREG